MKIYNYSYGICKVGPGIHFHICTEIRFERILKVIILFNIKKDTPIL